MYAAFSVPLWNHWAIRPERPERSQQACLREKASPRSKRPNAFRLVRWNENRRPHFMVSLTCLPAGITVEGATPRGGLTVNCKVKRLTRPDAAPAVKNGGSLPPPTPLPCGADAPGEGDTRGAASLRGLAWDAENPCYPASHAMFGKSPGPQRGGLRPLREKRCGCRKRETAG